jgi:predicted neuraminidase
MRLWSPLQLILIAICVMLMRQHAYGAAHARSKAAPAATVVASGFIFPEQWKDHVHSSSIVELSDGSLLSAWFQGSGECKADNVRIMGARRTAGAVAWGEPFLLADTPGHPDCNPVLWIDNEDRLWLFWSAILSNEWESSLVKYRISTNYLDPCGPPKWDWQDDVHLQPADFPRHIRSGWQQLLSTVWFAPRAIRAELSAATLKARFENGAKLFAVLFAMFTTPFAVHAWRQRRTGRGGWKWFAIRTGTLYASVLLVVSVGGFGYFSLQAQSKLNQRLGWMTASKPLQLSSGEIVLPLYSDRFLTSIMAISSDGGVSWEASKPLVGYGNIQPSLVESSRDELFAWMRENGPRKRVRYSVSADRGRSWSPVQESELPNPGCKVTVMALASGDWLMAYNPIEDGRHSLRLAISDDDGKSWRPFHQLEHAPGIGEFSYPSLTEMADGSIHVTYTHRLSENGGMRKSIKHVTLRRAESAPIIRMAEGAHGTLR